MSSSKSTTTEEEWVLDLLAGFRFHPTEEQMVKLLKKKMEGFMLEIDRGPWDFPGDQSISLFVSFLKKMMQGKDSQACQIIPEINVCKYEPWDLPELFFPDSPYQAREWFAFSRPDYKSINSPRCNRATKHGFWKITGKPREIGSQQHCKLVTFKKRTLTFYDGRGSKSQRTIWVMHEYFFTRTELGSTSNPNPQPDFVLCRLKKKAAKNKSDNKKLKDDSVSDELADPVTDGCMASNSEDDQAAANQMIPEAEERLAYKELVDAVLGSGDEDNGEPGGCVSSGFDNQAVDDMIQELSAQQEKYLDVTFFPPEQPRLQQPNQLGNVHDVCNDELVDPRTGGYIASNSGNQAAAINHMIPDPEELLAYKQLEHSLFWNSNHDDGEPGGCVSSDFHEMMQELHAQLGEDFDSSFPPPEPPQLGNVPDVYTEEECSSWPSPMGDTNNVSTDYDNAQVGNITNSFQFRATDESIWKVYSQPEENLEALFHPIQQEDYTLPQLPLLHSELGDVLHANKYIGCIGSQSPYLEIPTLFPQSS